MSKFVWIFIIFYSYGSILAIIHLTAERFYVDYYNVEYIRSMNASVRRLTRNSPYTLNVDFDAVYSFGNNISLKVEVAEEVSGRFIPFPVEVENKLCDFLQKNKLFGATWFKQISADQTCPFRSGLHKFRNIHFSLDDFPFEVPFTWSSATIKIRVTITTYLTEKPRVKMFIWNQHFSVIQKPKRQSNSG